MKTSHFSVIVLMFYTMMPINKADGQLLENNEWIRTKFAKLDNFSSVTIFSNKPNDFLIGNEMFFDHELQFDTSGNLISNVYFSPRYDLKTKKHSSKRYLFQERIHYDSMNRIEKLIVYKPNKWIKETPELIKRPRIYKKLSKIKWGEKISEISYCYDDMNTIDEITNTSYLDGGSEYLTSYLSEYDSTGKIVKRYTVFENGDLYLLDSLAYNQDTAFHYKHGTLWYVVYYDNQLGEWLIKRSKASDELGYFTFYYDKNGRITNAISDQANQHIRYEYNDRRMLIRERVFTDNKFQFQYLYEYKKTSQ